MEKTINNRPTLDDELDLISEIEYAKLMRKTLASVRNERSQDRGPPFVKIGARVWYPRKPLVAYISAHTVTPAREPTLIDGPRRRTARNRSPRPTASR